jgi:hypothetical protein
VRKSTPGLASAPTTAETIFFLLSRDAIWKGGEDHPSEAGRASFTAVLVVWHLLVNVIIRQLYKTPPSGPIFPLRRCVGKSPPRLDASLFPEDSSQPFQGWRIRRRIVRFVVRFVVRPFAQAHHGQAKRALQLVSMKAAWREALLCAGECA